MLSKYSLKFVILLLIYSRFLEAPDTFLQVNCFPNFGRQILEISQLCRSSGFYCLILAQLFQTVPPKKCFFRPLSSRSSVSHFLCLVLGNHMDMQRLK